MGPHAVGLDSGHYRIDASTGYICYIFILSERERERANTEEHDIVWLVDFFLYPHMEELDMHLELDTFSHDAQNDDIEPIRQTLANNPVP